MAAAQQANNDLIHDLCFRQVIDQIRNGTILERNLVSHHKQRKPAQAFQQGLMCRCRQGTHRGSQALVTQPLCPLQ